MGTGCGFQGGEYDPYYQVFQKNQVLYRIRGPAVDS